MKTLIIIVIAVLAISLAIQPKNKILRTLYWVCGCGLMSIFMMVGRLFLVYAIVMMATISFADVVMANILKARHHS